MTDKDLKELSYYINDYKQEDMFDIEDVEFDVNIMYNDCKIACSSNNHPVTVINGLGRYHTLSINYEYYLNHKEEINNILIDIGRSTLKRYFKISNKELITEEALMAISANNSILEVTLGTENSIYYLNQKEYELLKRSNKEAVNTKGVSKELEDNFDDIITYNRYKTLFDNNCYSNISNSKYLTIYNITQEEIPNLKYINNNVENLSISTNNINPELIPSILQELENINYQGNIKIEIENKNNKINQVLFNNYEQLSHMNNVQVIVSFIYKLSLPEYIENEQKLTKLIEPAMNLSPLEKFLYAYNKTKQFKEYKESINEKYESRDLYNLLNNDYMVCVGFTTLLKDLLDKLDIESTTHSVEVDTGLDKVPLDLNPINNNITTYGEGHNRLIVNLIDSKYNINGYYISDPTWDNSLNKDYYNHALMVSEESNSLERYNFISNDIDELLYSSTIEEFYYRVNYYLNHKRSFNSINDFYNDLYRLLTRVDKEFIKDIEDKFGNLTTYKREFTKREVEDIMEFIGNHIINKSNNKISGKTLKEGISVLYKDVYKVDNYEDLVEEIINYNKERQEHCFPKRYKQTKDGEISILLNETNKFDLEESSIKKRI